MSGRRQTPGGIVTFQELILSLQNYWAGQGAFFSSLTTWRRVPAPFIPRLLCGSLAPNRGRWPMSSLAALTDGRYGENPNRLQHYYQFQVIMKPSPMNIQEFI
ncbi:MAG: glycine--tRNA ligase subunit alpha [Syntrophotaleaceae bacterium]